MSEERPPYEKAIEEAAKATSKAVDLIRDGGRAIGPAVGDIYGLLIGDKVKAARVRNLEEINELRRKKLEDRGVKEPLQPPEDIAIPILEAAQGETRAEMQDMWARLLANAMDPARAQNVRPEFVDTIKELQPIDALNLTLARNVPPNKHLQVQTVIEARPEYRKSAVRVSFARLTKLGCAAGASDASTIRLLDYGLELLFAIEA